MMRGEIKKWFDLKGFGFIKPDDGSKDVFVHINALKRSGISEIEAGERVEFETAARGDKIEAVEIRKIKGGSDVDGNTAPGWLNGTAPAPRYGE